MAKRRAPLLCYAAALVPLLDPNAPDGARQPPEPVQAWPLAEKQAAGDTDCALRVLHAADVLQLSEAPVPAPPRFGRAFLAHRARLGLPPQRSPWTSPEAHRSKMRRVSPPTVTDEAMPDAPDPRVSPTTRAELVQLAREDPDALQALVSEVLREAARQNEAAPTQDQE